MATVFLAEDLKHQRLVAIKVLHPAVAAIVGLERFQREIEIAAKLQHPHILPLYDSGSAGGYLYYVMPFVEGESLRDLLDREKQLSQEDIIRLSGQVASALGYAHSHGVVHRDIKPENIMLSGGTAVVADFGIARALGEGEAAGTPLTQAGTVIGTPAYMSPEQSQGHPDIDGRSDQYSLACVVYEMLVGTPPFTGTTAQAIMARHSLDHVSPPSIVREAIPETMETAVLRALAKTPADRFPTVIMFAEALGAPSAVTGPRRGAAHRAALTRRWLGLPRPVVVGILAAAVVVSGWATRSLWSGSARAGATDGGLDPRHIAVLYFDDRSEGKGLQPLADGLTEALIHELSQVPALQVISRNGVTPFKSGRVAPDSIARVLQVGTLVEGTVAQSGGRLRVSVALSNAASGAEIGSTVLERPRAEIFALQDDLAKEVSLFLRQRLGQEVQLQESRVGTNNVGAWELVQQAQAVARDADPLQAAGDVPAAARRLARADSLLAGAERLDGSWAVPIMQRGWLAYRQSRLAGSFDKLYYANWIGQGLGHGERALRLTPTDPDALELRGTLRYWRWLLNLDPDAAAAAHLLAHAQQDLEAAVAARPTQATAWNTLSHLRLAKSETAEGKLAALKAYEADPYLTDANKTVWRLFSSSLDLEEPVDATHWCAEGGRRFPDDPRFVECQLLLRALKGQKPDVASAWRLLGKYAELSPPNLREFRRLRGEVLVAMALARAGLADSARSVAEHARTEADTLDQTRELAYLEAIVRTMLGDREEALRLLSTFLATNPQQRRSMARDQSWWFRDLRSDPRFKALVGSGS